MFRNAGFVGSVQVTRFTLIQNAFLFIWPSDPSLSSPSSPASHPGTRKLDHPFNRTSHTCYSSDWHSTRHIASIEWMSAEWAKICPDLGSQSAPDGFKKDSSTDSQCLADLRIRSGFPHQPLFLCCFYPLPIPQVYLVSSSLNGGPCVVLPEHDFSSLGKASSILSWS